MEKNKRHYGKKTKFFEDFRHGESKGVCNWKPKELTIKTALFKNFHIDKAAKLDFLDPDEAVDVLLLYQKKREEVFGKTKFKK